MNAPFLISYFILWTLVFSLVLLNLVLFRQVGIMVMGNARGINRSGLPTGRKIPNVQTRRVDGSSWSTSQINGEAHILLFGTPTCKECSEIIPHLKSVAKKLNIKPVLLLFSDMESAQEYAHRNNLDFDVVQMSLKTAEKLDVAVSPFAYGVNSNGVITGKGLVNSLQQLEIIADTTISNEVA